MPITAGGKMILKIIALFLRKKRMDLKNIAKTIQNIASIVKIKFSIGKVFKEYMGHSIQEWTKQKFLKAVFHKFYLVHS